MARKVYTSYEEYMSECFPESDGRRCKNCYYFSRCKKLLNLTGEEVKCSWFPATEKPSDAIWHIKIVHEDREDRNDKMP